MQRFKTIVTAVLFSLLVGSLCPGTAMADKGSGGGGSGSSGSGGSGSSGSSSSGHSGSSDSSGSSGSSGSGHQNDGSNSGSGSGADDDGGGGGSDSRGRSAKGDDRSYEGGWHERITNGHYELYDPQGRLVIRRSATKADLNQN
ncbi:MAG: hypothetical protein KGI75_14480 [Rhizobiaceae bacterium]|nr:hypothetical protein [Rhizobiaceae bacterium]